MPRDRSERKRFEVIHKESTGFARDFRILRDKETGVCYLFVHEGYAGGLTVMLDAEGKPLIDRGYTRY